MSDASTHAARDVVVPIREGLHTRPMSLFVDLASRYKSVVTNISRGNERVDGKSPFEMMLLEATQGCVLRIEAEGNDARQVVDALVAFVEAGFTAQSDRTNT